jgi:hypothetical protein
MPLRLLSGGENLWGIADRYSGLAVMIGPLAESNSRLVFLKVPVAQRCHIVHTVTIAVEVGLGLEAGCTDNPWKAVAAADWTGFAAGNRSSVRTGLNMEPVPADPVSRPVGSPVA